MPSGSVNISTNPYLQSYGVQDAYRYNGELPPEIAIEEQALNRRQQIANLLMQRGLQQPQGQMAGRFYVAPSPFQNLAQLAQVAAGAYGTYKTDQGRADLADKNKNLTAKAVEDYLAKMQGTPTQVPVQGPGAPVPAMSDQDLQNKEALGATPEAMASYAGMQQEGPQPSITVQQPPSEMDKRKMLVQAMTSRVPGLREAAQFQMQQEAKPLEHVDLGDRVMLMKNGQPVASIQKGIVPQHVQHVDAGDHIALIQDGKEVGQLKKGISPADKVKAMDQLIVPGPEGTPILNTPLVGAKKEIAEAGAAKQQTIVNSYTPASEEAQKDFIKSSRATYDQLKQAQPLLDNIEKAKALIPSAKGFMGTGGETLLSAAKFLNNRIGTSIDVEGVKSAEELRSRIFFNIMDNLKKMDAQPSQMQQQIMQESLGKLGTDPNALPAVLDAYADVVRGKIDQYNEEVGGAVKRGVKFPYDPVIKLKTPIGPGALSTGPVKITSDADYNALPSGATFIGPDGKTRKKP